MIIEMTKNKQLGIQKLPFHMSRKGVFNIKIEPIL